MAVRVPDIPREETTLRETTAARPDFLRGNPRHKRVSTHKPPTINMVITGSFT